MTILTRFEEFDRDKVDYRGIGIAKTNIAVNSTVNVDKLITNNSYLAKWCLIFSAHIGSDKYTLQLIDKDNVLGNGANYVYESLVTDWPVCPDVNTQRTVEMMVPIRIHANTYFRIAFTNTSLLTVVSVAGQLGTYIDV